MPKRRPALIRFLRSPKVIVGEIAAFVLAGILGGTFPQVGSASSAELARLRESGPAMATIVEVFALDHVFQSAWFLAIAVAAAASLSIAIMDQASRLRAMWSRPLKRAHFRTTPLRAEFARPSRAEEPVGEGEASAEIRTTGRIGLAGSLVFHAGLLVVIVAAGLRALFATTSVVDLVEGETLPPTAEAWARHWQGVLAKPLRFRHPVTLDAVDATHYETGDLRDLRIQVSIERTDGTSAEEVAVNRKLQLPGGRLFLGSDYGPAALLEWHRYGQSLSREAVLLTRRDAEEYEAESAGPEETRAYLRTTDVAAGNPSHLVEMRVVKGGALLFAGALRSGEAIPLPDGLTLTLHGTRTWARLRGSRDPGLWLAYLGFALVVVGATMIFAIVRVDTCIVVTPAGDRKEVFVALRPQRFAPLFRERFERLDREQGGVA